MSGDGYLSATREHYRVVGSHLIVPGAMMLNLNKQKKLQKVIIPLQTKTGPQLLNIVK